MLVLKRRGFEHFAPVKICVASPRSVLAHSADEEEEARMVALLRIWAASAEVRTEDQFGASASLLSALVACPRGPMERSSMAAEGGSEAGRLEE